MNFYIKNQNSKYLNLSKISSNLKLFSSNINSYNFKKNLNKIISINKNSRSNLNYKDFIKTPNIESNFISIPKEENYFTKNYSYINNKKIQFYDKYEFDNNKFVNDKQNIYKIKKIFQNRKKNYKNEFRLIKIKDKQIYEFNSEKNNSLFYFNDKDYLKNNNNSLYQELNIMKNKILKNYFKNNSSSKSQKLNNFSGYEYLLNKKQNKEILCSLKKNVIINKNLNYNNKSEKNRYIKMIEIFSNLKNLIVINQNLINKFDYIKEFLKKNNIEANKYNDENLNNFFNFINMKIIPIDFTKSLKQNILDGLNFNKENFITNLKKTFETNYFFKIKKYHINNSVNLLKNYVNQDMEKQKKLFEKEQIKNENIIIKDLENEINNIYEKYKLEININEIEKTKKNNKNLNINRIYYNWLKSQKVYKIYKIEKNNKLTEYLYLKRLKNKIKINEALNCK